MRESDGAGGVLSDGDGVDIFLFESAIFVLIALASCVLPPRSRRHTRESTHFRVCFLSSGHHKRLCETDIFGYGATVGYCRLLWATLGYSGLLWATLSYCRLL